MKKNACFFALLITALFASDVAASTKYNLHLATTVTSPHPWYQAAEYMAERVPELTNGEVVITIHGGGSLGNENAIVNSMRLGSVDLMILSFTPLASVIPEGALFVIPFIFDGYEHNARVMDSRGPIFPMLARYISDRKLGFTLLATGGGGARSFLNMQGPIVVPADMEGLKLRTVVNAMTKKIWALVDAIPMAVSATEAYSAVQTGVCNSIEASLSFFNSSRLTELAKYLSLSRHEFLVTHVSIRDLTLAKLSKEHQDAIKQAAMEAGDLVTKLGIEIDAEMVDYLIKKDDVKVNEIERAAFIDLFAPLQDELARDLPGTDKGLELLEAIRTLKD